MSRRREKSGPGPPQPSDLPVVPGSGRPARSKKWHKRYAPGLSVAFACRSCDLATRQPRDAELGRRSRAGHRAVGGRRDFMAQIMLRGVTKSWGNFIGVDAVDLEIRDREFMVFLGPSGCGKTTTMRMIAGLEEPTTGEIQINGEVVNEVDARDRDVAMVFQSYALYPNMSIYENIRFPLRMREIPRAEHDGLVRKAASMV